MKKIVIVSSTFRKNGNSELLAKQFEKGAQESGNSVQTIFLRDVKPQFCTGCLSCLNTGKCVLKDGVNALLPAVREADVLVFATPVYYYSMSGQLKTFLDRLNPLYGGENKFREVYLRKTTDLPWKEPSAACRAGSTVSATCALRAQCTGSARKRRGASGRRPLSVRRIKWARASADRRKRGGKNNAGKRI